MFFCNLFGFYIRKGETFKLLCMDDKIVYSFILFLRQINFAIIATFIRFAIID